MAAFIRPHEMPKTWSPSKSQQERQKEKTRQARRRLIRGRGRRTRKDPPTPVSVISILVAPEYLNLASTVGNDLPGDTAGQQSVNMPRMVGDFDDSANPLWSLHAKESKSHDEARIQSLKNNMDGILIFVRAFSFLYYFMPRTNVPKSSRQGYSLPFSLPLSSIGSKVFK